MSGIRTDLSEREIEDLAEAALNAACLSIQKEIGQTDGGWAGIFFSGPEGDDILGIMRRYVRFEMQMNERPDANEPSMKGNQE